MRRVNLGVKLFEKYCLPCNWVSRIVKCVSCSIVEPFRVAIDVSRSTVIESQNVWIQAQESLRCRTVSVRHRPRFRRFEIVKEVLEHRYELE